MNKAESVMAIQDAGLENQPSRIFKSRELLLDYMRKAPIANRFIVRTFSGAEQMNLPRAVDVDALKAISFALSCPDSLGYIVQPYDPIVSSAEIKIDRSRVDMEIISGVWELDNISTPILIAGDIHDRSCWVRTWPRSISRSRLVLPETGTVFQDIRPSPSTVLAYELWFAENLDKVYKLLDSLNVSALGIKVHESMKFGFSAQNLRLQEEGLPTSIDQACRAEAMVTPESLGAAQGASCVELRVSADRHNSQVITDTGNELVAMGVKCVHLSSGLLSHLAILLRESGLQTRRSRA